MQTSVSIIRKVAAMLGLSLSLAIAVSGVRASDTSTSSLLDDIKDHSAQARISVMVEPSGVDDTAALQAALDRCSGTSASCTIHLAAGDYYTNALVAIDFKGKIQGRGANRTIIRPVEGQTIRTNDAVPFWSVDPTPDAPYPYLISLVDGQIGIADLGFRFPDGPLDIDPWDVCFPIEGAIGGVIVATGRSRIDISLRNVAMTGGSWDGSPFFGRNVLNGAFYQSLLLTEGAPQIDWCAGEPVGDDFVLVGGRFSVSGSTVTNIIDPMPVYGASGLHVNASNNRFVGGLFGVDLIEMNDSKAVIVGNTIDAMAAGVEIAQNIDDTLGTLTNSTYHIVNNDISVNVLGDSPFGGFAGVEYLDFAFGAATDRSLKISGNRIHLGIDVLDGVFVLGDEGGARVNANTVTGTAVYAGIDVDASSGCLVAGNRFPGLSFGLAHIYLGAGTSDCHVVAPQWQVLDEGTNNTIQAP